MIYIFKDIPVLPVKVIVKRFSDDGDYFFKVTDREAFALWISDKFDWRKYR